MVSVMCYQNNDFSILTYLAPRPWTAVAIFAILQSKNPKYPPSTIIIEQYRPPVAAYVVEMPAGEPGKAIKFLKISQQHFLGLIDEGETPEEAAIRELEEETGYKADSVVETSPLLVCDPGQFNFPTPWFSLC